MATFEPAEIINRETYLKKIAKREYEQHLLPDRLYAFLGLLAHRELEAIRFPVTAKAVEAVGTMAVYLTLFDIDMQPAGQQAGEMNDGMFSPSELDPLKIYYEDKVARVKEGYLTNYDDGMGVPTIEAAQSEFLPPVPAGT